MKFFVPFTKDDAQAEEVYGAIRKFNTEQTLGPITSRRIHSICFYHNGNNLTATVGETFEPTGEPVAAILEGPIYYVCTPNRGFMRGSPILVGREEIRTITDFDA